MPENGAPYSQCVFSVAERTLSAQPPPWNAGCPALLQLPQHCHAGEQVPAELLQVDRLRGQRGAGKVPRALQDERLPVSDVPESACKLRQITGLQAAAIGARELDEAETLSAGSDRGAGVLLLTAHVKGVEYDS